MYALMTVEQFRQLPLDGGPWLHELHYGEVVVSARPKAKHDKLQRRLEGLLQARAGHLGIVGIEMPFRAVPQFDLRAPELVIEVKSASNSWAELRERASLCLANGCQDFWIVDEKARTVTRIAPDGSVVRYSGADCVPLPLFGGDGLRLSDVFK